MSHHITDYPINTTNFVRPKKSSYFALLILLLTDTWILI